MKTKKKNYIKNVNNMNEKIQLTEKQKRILESIQKEYLDKSYISIFDYFHYEENMFDNVLEKEFRKAFEYIRSDEIWEIIKFIYGIEFIRYEYYAKSVLKNNGYITITKRMNPIKIFGFYYSDLLIRQKEANSNTKILFERNLINENEYAQTSKIQNIIYKFREIGFEKLTKNEKEIVYFYAYEYDENFKKRYDEKYFKKN
jgi:hypothetical protein